MVRDTTASYSNKLSFSPSERHSHLPSYDLCAHLYRYKICTFNWKQYIDVKAECSSEALSESFVYYKSIFQ